MQSIIVLIVFEFSLQRLVEVLVGREFVVVEPFFELVESAVPEFASVPRVWVDVSFDLLLIAWVRDYGSGCGLCHRTRFLWLVELKIGFKLSDKFVTPIEYVVLVWWHSSTVAVSLR